MVNPTILQTMRFFIVTFKNFNGAELQGLESGHGRKSNNISVTFLTLVPTFT